MSLRRHCHRTSGVPVIAGLVDLRPPDHRPSPLPAPSREGRHVATNRDTFHRRGGLAPLPGSAARKPLARSRYRFAACGFPRTARPPSTTPATTGAASDGQASPTDFCNQSRRTGTTCERPLLERTPLGALSVARIGGLPRRRTSSGREQALCRPNYPERACALRRRGPLVVARAPRVAAAVRAEPGCPTLTATT